jgi:tetratricopeptide (TPR) repeat protein
MKIAYLTALIALTTFTSVGYAGSVDDAEAGSAAFERGDYATAERLFTRALGAGELNSPDRESALVMRARAYIAEGREDLGLKDVEQALELNLNDQEAAKLKHQLQGDAESDVYYSCNATYSTLTPTPDGRALGYNDQRRGVQGSFELSLDTKAREVVWHAGSASMRDHFSLSSDEITWYPSGMRGPAAKYPNEKRLAYLGAPVAKLSRSDGLFVLTVNYNLFTETNYASCTRSQ